MKNGLKIWMKTITWTHIFDFPQQEAAIFSQAQPFLLIEALVNSSQVFCMSEISGCHKKIFHTIAVAGKKLLHREALHTASFCPQKLVHTHRSFFTKSIYTQQLPNSSFVLQSLRKVFPSSTLYWKACAKCSSRDHFACAKYLPVLLCTTQVARSTSLYYSSLRRLRKALPSTTLYYIACAKFFPVQFCTKRLVQSTSQYDSVLHSLPKVLPGTSLYYKGCTKYFPVHPSTTLYFKTCTKYFPVVPCTAQRAQSTSQDYFVLQSLREVLTKCCTQSKLLHREAFTHTHSKHSLTHTQQSFSQTQESFSQQGFIQTSPYTEKLFTHSEVSHREASTEKLSQALLYTQKLSHTHKHTRARSKLVHTQKLLHRASFDTASLYTEKLLRTERVHTQQAFTHSMLLHIAAFTHRKLLYTASFCTEKLDYAQRRQKLQLQNWNSAPKRKKDNNSDALFRRKILKENRQPQNEKICWQISIGIAALMQPPQQNLPCAAAKDNSITHAAMAPRNLVAAITVRSAETELRSTIELRTTAPEIEAPKPDFGAREEKDNFLSTFSKHAITGNSSVPKLRKSADKSVSQPWCSHSNTTHDSQLQSTGVFHRQSPQWGTWM